MQPGKREGACHVEKAIHDGVDGSVTHRRFVSYRRISDRQLLEPCLMHIELELQRRRGLPAILRKRFHLRATCSLPQMSVERSLLLLHRQRRNVDRNSEHRRTGPWILDIDTGYRPWGMSGIDSSRKSKAGLCSPQYNPVSTCLV